MGYQQNGNAAATNGAAGGKPLLRPRYFPRQMVTPDDLTQGLNYARERIRRHNRALHGWGVVYGAEVRQMLIDGQPRKLQVLPGLVITPQGDEIEITSSQTIDPSGDLFPSPPNGEEDPWYSSVAVDRHENPTLHLAVRYVDELASPVRVPPVDCGCNDRPCEYSRIADSYEFALLTSLPESHQPGDSPFEILTKGIAGAIKESAGDSDKLSSGLLTVLTGVNMPSQPPAIKNPWVVLATITLTGGVVTSIDPVSYRRMVVSLAPFWWRPQGLLRIIKVGDPTDVATTAGRVTYNQLVEGSGLSSVAKEGVWFENSPPSSPASNALRVEALDHSDQGNPSDTKLKLSLSFAAGQTPDPGRLVLSSLAGGMARSKEKVPVPPTTPAATPAPTPGT